MEDAISSMDSQNAIREMTSDEVEYVIGGSSNGICLGASAGGLVLGGIAVGVAVVTAGSAVAFAAGVGLAMGGLFFTSAGAATCDRNKKSYYE